MTDEQRSTFAALAEEEDELNSSLGEIHEKRLAARGPAEIFYKKHIDKLSEVFGGEPVRVGRRVVSRWRRLRSVRPSDDEEGR